MVLGAINPSAFNPDRFVLNCRGRSLDCRPGNAQGAQVMGILNVTPDSFSDGGLYLNADAALAQVEQMLSEGASIIDVGGESSRPKGSVYGKGAEAVPADEEKRRVIPVVEAIAQRFPDAVISVDTYKPEVAEAVLEAGAHIINDITGLRIFPDMAAVIAKFQVPLIVMHSLGRPGELPHEHPYDDVVSAVADSLQQSVDGAIAAGVQQIVTDPGFGFGKSIRENLQLVSATDHFLALGYPVLMGVSRKSTIGAMLRSSDNPAPINERLYGSLGATATAVLKGATLIRTHDVRPTVEMLKLLSATAFTRN
ncbi:MAG: dihydropteroate synthase [Leptolyngbyaceae bacterium]|nr:dihydropteroate synthase [Leptolyngbyaceae bacterium]